MKTNEYGAITGRGIHDALVEEFASRSADFTLQIRGQEGEVRLLLFHDVKELGFKDFVKGAIVSDIFCWSIAKLSLTEPISEAWRVVLGRNFADRDFDAIVDSLTAKYSQCSLVFVECSYGGAIALICSEVAQSTSFHSDPA